MMSQSGSKEVERAAQALACAKLVAVSSGAGISKESGIPTFRDALNGLWAKYDPQQLATPQAFKRDPDLVWSWYMYRTKLVHHAEPNPGHYALAELEQWVLKVVVLTQNIGGLHARAGSTDIVELHGRLGRFKCFADCKGSPTLVDLEDIDYNEMHAPLCPHCKNASVRPDVVWYGETLPSSALRRAFEVAIKCDVMLVVGTSGIVQPAAALPCEAKRAGATVIEANTEPSQITSVADVFLRGASGQVLPQLTNALTKGKIETHEP